MGVVVVWSVCLHGEDRMGVARRIGLLSLGAIDVPVNIDEIGIDKVTGRKLLSELQGAVVALQEAELRAAARQNIGHIPLDNRI